MADQVELVGRAKIIILNEGANVLVNGYFAKNSHIIVLGGHGPNNGYHFQNPRPALIYYDSVKNGNSYYHVSYSSPVSYVLEVIDKIKENIIEPILTPAVKCWRENWKGCRDFNEMNWRYPESLNKIDNTN